MNTPQKFHRIRIIGEEKVFTPFREFVEKIEGVTPDDLRHGALGGETVVIDLRDSSADRWTLLGEIQLGKERPYLLGIVGHSDQESIMRAIELGVDDLLSYPFPIDALQVALWKEEARLRRAGANLRDFDPGNSQRIIFQSEKMKEVLTTIERLKKFHTTVLIKGESGTGKELIAKEIHRTSPRKNGPFIPINCGAIPENLVESELFGHRKGAFTDASRDKRGLFEEATNGTLFLDEIGELPLHLQVKLLRALQEQQIRRVGDEALISIDVRVIAATLRDLEQDVENNRFRDDLYYRLNVVSLELPALRDRPEDIPLLVSSFIKKLNRRLNLRIRGVEKEAMEALQAYSWRGNVRELENCIERAMVLSTGDTLSLAGLPAHISGSHLKAGTSLTLVPDGSLSIKERTKELEIALITRALDKTGGNRTRAAKVLEISHRALLYKLKEYGLSKAAEEEGENE